MLASYSLTTQVSMGLMRFSLLARNEHSIESSSMSNELPTKNSNNGDQPSGHAESPAQLYGVNILNKLSYYYGLRVV